MNALTVLALRLVLAAAGGVILRYFFFRQVGWWLAVVLGIMVLAAAYVSEMWRRKS